MSQIHCPRCNDPVRLPADLPSEAVIRCPLCSEEYTYAEVEASLPPMVEIVSLPESSDLALSHIDSLLAPKNSSESAPKVAAPLVSTSASARTSSRRRPAESPWRPLILLVEIALSGIVGIALAVLVLWWLPGQWHRDPLSLKPVASKYAPWLLPPKHRPLADLEPVEEKPAADRKRAAAQASAKPTSTKPKEATSKAQPSTNTDKDPTQSKPVNFEEPAQSNEPAPTQKSLDLEMPELPKETELTQEKPKTKMEDLTKGLPPDHWLNQPEGPPEPPELVWTSSVEISSLIRDAERRRKEPPKPNFDFPERTEPNFVATFRELARVSGQVSAEDVGMETARTRLREWLSTLPNEDWKAALEASAKDLPKDSIAPRGIVYLANLKLAGAEGSWLHLELEPNPGSPTFPILIDPANFHACGGDELIGKEIYVLAAELPDPRRLVTDVPANIKKTWLVGAIRAAETQSAEPVEPKKSSF